MKDLIIQIAHQLWVKNRAFCIYRFPNENDYHLAIQKDLIAETSGNTLWMAPFSYFSKAENVYWDIVNHEMIDTSLLEKIQSLPAQEKISIPLAPETSEAIYFESLDKLLKEIHSGQLQKAIMSRVFYEEKPKDFDPIACFERLAKDYPNTFAHISLHPQSGMWMGATPELLLRKEKKEMSIMALAGTQARKEHAEYQWREKEIEEHLMVGQHIETVAQQYHCHILQKDGPQTIEAGRVAHLKTDYVLQAEEDFELRPFLKALHPTPAVGGLPVDVGVESINRNETYDRKYYCGFIGETNFEDYARLYINLRCMQIGNEKIAIFVGGGITAASQAQEEWQETIMKSKTMVEKIRPENENNDSIQ